MRPDMEIKLDVESELRSDPLLQSADIAVNVKDAVALLSGFVRRYRLKRQAEAAAKRVIGVVGVANDIEVRLPLLHQRPDPMIVRDVVEALQEDLPDVADRIKVTAEEGWVTLEGEVEWNYEREEARWCAYRQRGVVGVSNLIRLKRREVPNDVLQRIVEAFKRNAAIDADHITVEVAGSEVRLRGTARSWAEREEAERVVWTFSGVTKVDNEIAVEP